jgi:hypothetical protein
VLVKRREFIAGAGVLAAYPNIVAARDGTKRLGVLMDTARTIAKM